MRLLAAVGMELPVELVVVLFTTEYALLLCTSQHELYSVSLANAFALQLIHIYGPIMTSQQSATVGRRLLVHSYSFGLHAGRFQSSTVSLTLSCTSDSTFSN